jgi:hypothetical protein
MRPMIWHPEAKDQRVKKYLDHINHAPYFGITIGILGVFMLFTTVVLLGIF